MGIALYFMAAKNCSASMVGDIFTEEKQTVKDLLLEFCEAVTDTMANKYIAFPNTKEKKEALAKEFSKKLYFPNTFGALDVTQIPITTPEEYSEDYLSTKKYHSVVLMAIVDAKGRFIYYNVGRPSCVKDGVVLKDCKMMEELVKTEPHLHLVGDGAFPLMTNLMKPYNDAKPNKLTPQQEYFNKRLNKAHAIAVNAFDRVRGRFSILMTVKSLQVANVKAIVTACLALHNFCEERDEKFWVSMNNMVALYNERMYKQPEYSNNRFDCSRAKEKRDRLCQQLA